MSSAEPESDEPSNGFSLALTLTPETVFDASTPYLRGAGAFRPIFAASERRGPLRLIFAACWQRRRRDES